MKFYKYQGLGNDFIILEEKIDVNLVPKLCDRNFGIGADGVIIDSIKEGKPFMEFYNADGSVATMCGNGIRAYANFLDSKGRDFSVIKTLAGDKYIEKIEENKFKVCIGKPRLDFIDKEIRKGIKFDALFTGVEHLVLFDNEEKYGIDFLNENSYDIEEDKSLFPDGTNINIVRILDKNHIKILTHERGVGVTLACGTGACASSYMSYYKGYVGNKVNVELLGGNLDIEIMEDNTIYMIGEAKKVFIGEIEL